MALDMKPLFAEQAKERHGTRTDLVPHEGTKFGKTRDQLAKIAKVSKSSIDYAEYIKSNAPAVAVRQDPQSFENNPGEGRVFPPRSRTPIHEDVHDGGIYYHLIHLCHINEIIRQHIQ